ncbi:amidohydrolase [Litorimonas haliclonae]|uniref:amidohydrolase n=1 Tax=Litorimonas haliclonae TaxID=2081977 RepID=UPI0039EECA5A
MTLYKTFLLSGIAFSFAACGPEKVAENRGQANAHIEKSWCISGGPIYTALDLQPTVEAVAVTSGEITYAGPETDQWCQSETSQRINLNGAALYPGLTDGHAHLIGIGLREMTLNLEGTDSIADLKSQLAEEVEKAEDGQTVYGRGWIETHWPEKRFPTRQDLDEVAPDNPVILTRADGHASVVNSLALEKSGIDKATEAPFGGAINLSSDGEPTGMLIDKAQDLVSDLMPSLTPERRREAYIQGAELYASRGWANLHSMSVEPNDIALMQELANSEDIKIRVYNSIDLQNNRAIPTMETDTAENDLITTRAIKLYADGALGSRGAALLAPYSDDPDNDGLMTLKEVQVEAFLETALRNGIQVNTHAIGDRANRYVLQWYKDAFETVPKSSWKVEDPRWRVEHAQIVDVEDIPLFAEYGIIPSMQPSHAIGDLHFAVDRLGKKRLEGGYAWRSLIDSGSIIVGGSDAPVEVGDPRIEFYAATQRKDMEGYSDENWYPEEKVSRQEALKMFTIWPAYASFEEDKLGTIEVGKRADFSAFKTDLMTAPGPEILTSEPLFTMVNGKMAFDGREE